MTVADTALAKRAWIVPIACLFGAGSLLGLSTNIAKLASDMGIPPVGFLLWSIAGATLLLGLNAFVRGQRLPLTGRAMEYYLVAAFVTVAGSNLIFFTAVPHVGAGFVALTITLPPLLTYLGALTLGMERFQTIRAAGVAAALAGAGVLAIAELNAPDAPVFWILLTLMGPVLLAIGNLYRSLRWPDGASAEALAPGMLAAATIMLIIAGTLPDLPINIPFDASILALTAGQSILFAGQFLLLFILQKTGGPVLLSLLGSVGAVVGVPVAVYVLGEEPPAGLAVGAALIALGIGLVVLGQRRTDSWSDRHPREAG